jgi:phenylacetate-CoA ligase
MRGYKLRKHLSNYLYNRNFDQISVLIFVIIFLTNYKYYTKTLKLLKKSERWTKEQIEDYQLKKLNSLLAHAYENVPYYNKILANIKINEFSNLEKIPFLTKELIQQNIDNLKAKNYPEYKFQYYTTGGSTAIPLGFYEEKGVQDIIGFAYYKYLLKNFDCKLTDKFVILTGIVFPSGDKSKFWKYTFFKRCLILSSYHLTEKNLPRYIEKIRKMKTKIIFAYPSSLSIIASFMKKNNIAPIKSLKIIIYSAESLYEWQKDLLEDVFQCKIIGIYGHSEKATHAHTCKKSDYYHFFPQFGIVELIDKNGKQINKENKLGEIVVTGFYNNIFPFIRYKTGDYGTFTNKKCPCNRNYPTMKRIEGRIQEFIITKNDRLIPLTAINMHSNVFDNVKQFQFYQDTKEEVILNIIPSENYTKKDTEYIKKEVSKKLGNDIKLKLKFVKEIPRTKRGKHRFIIQKIPIAILKKST